MRATLEPQQIAASASTPPYVDLPAANLFAHRAERLRALAPGHELQAFLRLVADLSDVQQSLLDQPPAAATPSAECLLQCQRHGLPPLAFESLVRDGMWQPWLQASLQRYRPAGPPAVRQALASLELASAEQRLVWALSLLSGHFSAVPAAVVPFMGAALQAAWTYWLRNLPNLTFEPRASLSQCPGCGSPAMAGVIRQRGAHNGLRYLVCSLCACQWHVVRVKCVYCEQSKGLDYVSLASDRHSPETAPLRAETCPMCHQFLKLLYLEHDSDAEVVSGDLTSLALDIGLDQNGFNRLAPNLMVAPGG
ncbi:formate dehydrogenase accessory protein FdhE [Pseudomonas eucalypticola]|uniref:Protein FdhE homolog n=1 Tax=Pseudomonas eucalypticola TaxID=2599595 RepID=A0A7D5D7B7_9PSED|nr:formate dehydrogenase accessory protein FdhE [Pseudomonas eucalypticola]QKZ04700.1 formate dehydrogenase accessory protein FdhE [Pseudomonas eucalypticola]